MRFAPSLVSLLLCGSVLAGCASDNNGVLGNLGQHKSVSASADNNAIPTDVESGVRQAQQARLAGHYDDAIHTLSQLMLLASDDPGVVGEYGKALAEKGRAQDAVQFLTRATELQPRDWTLYSALGVAYDETGDQNSARQAYTHALALKPDEPSVLNNYALSRMLANDPAMARDLIASAARAGGASDAKIAHNIALVNSLAAAPAPVAQMPIAQIPVAQAPAAKAPVAEGAARVPLPIIAQGAQTRPMISLAPLAPGALPAVPAVTNPQVVMQAVPVDPLAGPVKSHTKPQAKPAVPDDKTTKAASGAGTKPAIPNLRQAALNY